MKNRTTPLVSVVIPSYNHGQFLGRALQAVLDQTYTNWEAIVIDNNSTDNTDEVIASFTDRRITYLKIQNGGIIAASRNAGIKVAKGEWIAFLDSDDWWTIDKLQVCFDGDLSQVDVIHHDLEIIGNRPAKSSPKFTRGRQLIQPAVMDLLLSGNALSNSSVMVRKYILEQVGGLLEDLKMIGCEDYNTWLRIALISENFLFIPRVLGFYQYHQENISSKDQRLSWECAIDNFKHLLPASSLLKIRAPLNYGTGRRAFLDNDFKNAYYFLKSGFLYVNTFCKLKSAYMILLIVFRIKR
jgi:glycosyltransferase involved in cell wall biosynthesis